MSIPDRILVGGNHLASALIGLHCMPAEQQDYGQVLHDFGQPAADIWVCWKAIMDERDKPITHISPLQKCKPPNLMEGNRAWN